jgi:putative hydrolase of the HAD superfamily
MIQKPNGLPVLLIDADDTLWENNIFYERVIRRVQDLLLPCGVDPQFFREHLNETERRSIPIHGYGTVNFTHSLVSACRDCAPPELRESFGAQAQQWGLELLEHSIELIEGVPETLEYLALRHPLHLITKGAPDEQERKIRASGLARFFQSVEILREKSEAHYRELLGRHGWNAASTWMIGNSPRSDINPAVAAGMNAVFIPHPHTWVLEHEPPVRNPRVLRLARFADLRSHF